MASTRLLSQYSPEKCGYCQGRRIVSESGERCEPCQGRGIVLVLQPPRVCPRCEGNGKSKGARELAYNIYYCPVCLGTGWIMTQMHSMECEPKP